ncbi:MAG: prepilin peptidase [Marinosulfonomonas sp.]|nr:prepilin peptidase [Marinosulfonomonas sp.]
MAITAWSAQWFLPFALPICIWVAWNDMKFMKIPNKAVVALTVIFLVVGLVALPLAEYPWRLLHLVVILAIGFGLNLIGSIGAGDAKFAAAMAPFMALGDLRNIFYLFAAVLLAAVLTHRAFKRSDRLRALAPGWKSWTTRDFPMGLALGGTLAFYLILGALFGN